MRKMKKTKKTEKIEYIDQLTGREPCPPGPSPPDASPQTRKTVAVVTVTRSTGAAETHRLLPGDTLTATFPLTLVWDGIEIRRESKLDISMEEET